MGAPTRQIKVLHVLFSLEPGGMENGVVNVANALDPNEFSVHFCCLEREGAFVQRLRQTGTVRVLGKQAGFSFVATLKLARIIMGFRPNVVHTHNLGPLIYGALGTGFGLLCPILHGEHSLLISEECQARRLRQRKLFYRACRKVHAVSAGLRTQLVGLGLPPRQIVTLLNGVDHIRFSPGVGGAEIRRRFGISENGFVIGIVGRFGRFKRHAEMLQAFERVAANDLNLHLLVVGGGGPEEQRTRAMAATLAARSRVHLAGFQSDVVPYYQAMNLLAIPSVNEGLSNAALEAMSCGVPVLANDTCGNAEIICSGNNGIIADLNTSAQLCEALQKVLGERHKLGKMAEMARENVVQNCSMAGMVEKYRSIYREVAYGS